jgi:heterodisulfide reductase subunit C
MQDQAEFDVFAPFDPNKCTICGECLHQCPVMNLPLDVVQKEMTRLILDTSLEQ